MLLTLSLSCLKPCGEETLAISLPHCAGAYIPHMHILAATHTQTHTHTRTHTHTPSHLCLTPVLSVLTFSGRTSLIPNAEASALPMAPVHIPLSPLPSSRGLLIFLPLPLKVPTTSEQGQCDPKWH